MLPTLFLLASVPLTPAQAEVTPLPRAHAHNDYQHARPLLDALDHGFLSVEADIFLVEGELRVGHDLVDTRPGRTLQALYLDPLLERVRQHGGSVYSRRKHGPLTLLVDIKARGEAVYAELRRVLPKYREMLTLASAGTVRPGAVTLILSGDRPISTVAAERSRYVFLDGRLPDLEGKTPPSLMPLVSDNFLLRFRWRGEGPMPPEERARLRGYVRQAHAQGRRLRLWASPDKPSVWRELDEAGVDLINTDDLPGLRSFLLTRRRAATAGP
jgi:hypothetical protein